MGRMHLVTMEHLFQLAAQLRSEDGENPEYDRALIELCRDSSGISSKDEVAEMLGIALRFGD